MTKTHGPDYPGKSNPFRCGLMLNPEEYVGKDDILTAQFFQGAIGAGTGCDSEPPLTDFLPLAFDNSTVVDGEIS